MSDSRREACEPTVAASIVVSERLVGQYSQLALQLTPAPKACEMDPDDWFNRVEHGYKPSARSPFGEDGSEKENVNNFLRNA